MTTRRTTLTAAGAVSLGAIGITPAAHPPREIVRKDITESHAGVPLTLRVQVINHATGNPAPGAWLHVRHCDALGVYSSGRPGGGTFLRGVQPTDPDGRAEFITIFPGWYAGRAVHIHAKVHVGGHLAHTGQLFFPEEITRAVADLRPYRSNQTLRTTNETDQLYNAGGPAGLLHVEQRHPDLEEGLLATITVSINPEATPATTWKF